MGTRLGLELGFGKESVSELGFVLRRYCQQRGQMFLHVGLETYHLDKVRSDKI